MNEILYSMMNLSYIFRLAYGSFVAILITIILGFLVMWMNGLLVEERPNTQAYTPCILGTENNENIIMNPYKKKGISLECINDRESKPLLMQWFEKIFSSDKENKDNLNNFIKKN